MSLFVFSWWQVALAVFGIIVILDGWREMKSHNSRLGDQIASDHIVAHTRLMRRLWTARAKAQRRALRSV